MLEGILEKVLRKYFGEYLEEIDYSSLHLGIWKGNIELSNLKIKKDLLTKFKLPFKIILGSIEYLNVQVPWRNLSSDPISIELRGLHLLIVPLEKKSWEIIETDSADIKCELLEKIGKKMLIALEKEAEKKGYFQNLVTKIIDNVQILIKDIHIRMEDQSGGIPYSTGLFLQELRMETTDEGGETMFIDRTQEKHKFAPLFKFLDLVNIGLYWNPKEKKIISDLEGGDQEKDKAFIDILGDVKNKYYILHPMSLILKMKEVRKGGEVMEPVAVPEPKYQFNLKLPSISFGISKRQYTSIINLLQVANEYQRFQLTYKGTHKYKLYRPLLSIGQCSPEQKESTVREWLRYAVKCVRKDIRTQKGWINQFMIPPYYAKLAETDFKNIYRKIMRDTPLELEEVYRYEQILTVFDLEILKVWGLYVVQGLAKGKEMIKQKEKEKKKAMEPAEPAPSKGGFFRNLFGGGNNEQEVNEETKTKEVLDEDEWDEIFNSLEKDFNLLEMFEEEGEAKPDEDRLSIKFELDSTTVYLNHKKQGLEEGIKLSLHNIYIHFLQSPNTHKVSNTLDSIAIDLYSNRPNHQTLTSNILRSIQSITPIEGTDQKYLNLTMVQHTEALQKSTDLSINFKPIEITYKSLFFDRLEEILQKDIEIDASVREAAKEAIEELKYSTQQKLKSPVISNDILNIHLYIASPQIIIPIPNNDGIDPPLWYLKLGNLCVESVPDGYGEFGASRAAGGTGGSGGNSVSMSSGEGGDAHTLSKAVQFEVIYDTLKLELTSSTLQYYESMKAYIHLQEQESERDIECFSLFKDANFILILKRLLGVKPIAYNDVPSLIIELDMTQLKIEVNPKIYKELLEINKCFESEMGGVDSWGEIQTVKQEIIRSSTKIGVVVKRGVEREKFHCVLSGGYLYFYADSSTAHPNYYYYLKNTNIIPLEEPNSFKLKNNKGNEMDLGVQGQVEYKQWMEVLNKQIGIMSDAVPLIQNKTKNYEDVKVQLSIQMESFMVKLLNSKNKELAHIQLKDFNLNLRRREEDFKLGIYLDGLNLYSNELVNFPDLIIKERDALSRGNSHFLEVDYREQTQESPLYKNKCETRIIKVELGKAKVIFPPNFINEMMRYLMPPSKEPPKERNKRISQKIGEEYILPNIPVEGEKVITCRENPEIDLNFSVTFRNLNLIILHHKYNTPVLEGKLGTLEFKLVGYIDHTIISGKISSVEAYDLTNYPYTLNPEIYMPERIKPSLMFGIQEEKGIDNELRFEMRAFKEMCPLEESKNCNNLHMELNGFYMNYMQELFLDRFLDIVMDQVVAAFDTDPVIDPITVKNMPQSPTDPPRQTKVTLNGHNLKLILHSRPEINDFFTFSIEEMRMNIHKEPRPGRKFGDPLHELLCTVLQMNAHMKILYNDTYPIINDIELEYTLDTPSVDGKDLHKYNPKEFNMGNLMKLTTTPLQIRMRQKHFYELMRIIDLNLLYNDDLPQAYDYKKIDQTKKQLLEQNKPKEGIKLVFDLICPSISLCAEEKNGILLGEVAIVSLNMNFEQLWEETRKLDIQAASIFLLIDENQDRLTKKAIIAPIEEGEEIMTDNTFYSNLSTKTGEKNESNLEIHMSENINQHVTWVFLIKNHNIFAKIAPLLSLTEFFTEGMPKYETGPKPKNFTKNNENINNMPMTRTIADMNHCLIVLPNQEMDLVLALTGEININLQTEKLSEVLIALNEYKINLFQGTKGRQIPYKTMCFGMHDIELFISKFSDIQEKKNISKIWKRQLFQPFTFTMGKNEALIIDSAENIYGIIETPLVLSKFMGCLSYLDMYFIAKTASYLIERIEEDHFRPQIQMMKCDSVTKSELIDIYNNKKRERIEKMEMERGMQEGKQNILIKCFEDLNFHLDQMSKISSVKDRLIKEVVHLEHMRSDEPQRRMKDNIIPENRPQRKQMTLNSDGISFIIMHEGVDVMCPIFSFSNDQLMFESTTDTHTNMETAHINVQFSLSSNYYNVFASTWEPIIEHSQGYINIDKRRDLVETKVFSNNPINLNLSDTFVQLWRKTFKAYSEDENSIHQLLSRSGDKLAPFVIENNTDYLMQITKTNLETMQMMEDQILLPPGGMIDIPIEHKILLDQVKKGDVEINMLNYTYQIFFEPQTKIIPINRINLNKVGASVHYLFDKKARPEAYFILSTELEGMKKILRIRAPVILQNQTNNSIQIGLISKGTRPSEYTIEPQKYISLPLNWEEYAVCFLNSKYARQSSPQELSLLVPFLLKKNQAHIQFGDEYYTIIRERPNSYTNIPLGHNICVLTPLCVRNALPFSMTVRDVKTQQNRKTLHRGSEVYMSTLNLNTDVHIEGKIDGYRPFVFNCSPDRQQKGAYSIKVVDYQGKSLIIKAKILSKKEGGFMTIIFYPSCIIIDQTRCDIPISIFYVQEDGTKISVAAQENNYDRGNLLLLSDESHIAVSLRNVYFSESMSIRGVGTSTNFKIKEESQNPRNSGRVFEFTAGVRMSQPIPPYNCNCRLITLSPRYILVNNTSESLILKQTGYLKDPVPMFPKDRIPFHWMDKYLPQTVQLRVFEEDEMSESLDSVWDWSAPFQLNTARSFSLANRNLMEPQRLYLLRIDLQKKDGTSYVIINKESVRHPEYFIHNLTASFFITYSQKGFDTIKDVIKPQSKVPFAWTDCGKRHILQANFSVYELRGKDTEEIKSFSFDLDKVGYENELTIDMGKGFGHTLFLSIYTDGYTKIFQISDTSKKSKTPRMHLKDSSTKLYKIEFRKLGISLLGTPKILKRRHEIIYLELEGIRVKISAENNETRISQMQIDNFQITNPLSQTPRFPLLSFPQKIPQKKGSQSPNFLELEIQEHIGVAGKQWFEEIRLKVHPFALCGDGDLIGSIIQVTRSIGGADDARERRQRVGKESLSAQIFEKAGEGGERKVVKITEHWVLSKAETKIYIGQLIISPLDILMTYHRAKGDKVLRDLLGIPTKNIENAHLKTEGICLTHTFGSSKEVAATLKDYYKEDLLINGFRLLFSIDILGNPAELMHNVKQGVFDFFTKPIEGIGESMKTGNIGDAGMGLVEGTASLGGHLIGGVLGSAGKITGGLSGALKDLVGDKKEESKIEQPKNVIEGVGKGAVSVGKGLFGGITGIFTDPIKGGKKGGAKGFFKGVGTGLGGLIARPVSGGLDLISKTSQGLKNTPQAIVGKHTKEMRVRPPRMFYSSLRTFKEFNMDDAQMPLLLEFLKVEESFRNEDFCNSFIFDKAKKPQMLLITENHIMLLDLKEKNRLWAIGVNDIQVIESKGNQIEIFCSAAELMMNWATIQADDNEIIKQMFKALNKFSHNYG